MLRNNHEKIGDNNNRVRAYIVLTGRVQGVAFRYYARNIANRHGVKGWIRNLDNGDVEVTIEGERNSVNQMIEWCKEGPSLALVEDIKIIWQSYAGDFSEFHVR